MGLPAGEPAMGLEDRAVGLALEGLPFGGKRVETVMEIEAQPEPGEFRRPHGRGTDGDIADGIAMNEDASGRRRQGL
jgi:hypothetical protein